jgi:2-amino-4-hydroxy-6-hydroxymethyldihydropteridine diphosphokinase
MMPSRAVVGLGSNLGNRLAHLQAALDLLTARPRVAVQAVSPVYETEPVGGPPQPAYLNAVALLSVRLEPAELLEALQAVEAAQGRVRQERWGPRTLDLDLVAQPPYAGRYGALTLPHPRAHQRPFVLRPWLDVDPAAILQGYGAVVDLLTALPAAGVRRLDELRLAVPA